MSEEQTNEKKSEPVSQVRQHDPGKTRDVVYDGVSVSLGDQPAGVDLLGFEPYVRAVAQFIVSDDTEPPLTISIEGSWGSGKSSFMKQLAEIIENTNRGPFWNRWFGRRRIVVWFNAWRHDKLESLHSAFVLTLLRRLRRKLPMLRRTWGFVVLWIRRFRFGGGGWLELVRLGVLWLFLVSATLLIFTKGAPALKAIIEPDKPASGSAEAQTPPQRLTAAPATIFQPIAVITGSVAWIASWTSCLFVVLLLFERIAKASDPIKLSLKDRRKNPDYERQLSFVDQFHSDLGDILVAYTGSLRATFRLLFGQRDAERAKNSKEKRKREARIFVLIDDLDRCEIPKSADLLQGINLMISDSTQVVFVIGIDRRKVGAALAVKYKDILPYFPVVQTSQKGEQAGDVVSGLEFGYGFLEKFIQVAFQVPRPSKSHLEHFLRSLEHQESIDPNRRRYLASVSTGIKHQYKADKDHLLRVAEQLVPCLDFNPRRIKQFLNVFRLRWFLAAHTDLLGEIGEKDRVTVEQLAKFSALVLCWPGLIADLLIDKDLLRDLHRALMLKRDATVGDRKSISPEANSRTGAADGRFKDWFSREGVGQLLLLGLDKASPNESWSMEDVPVERLLEVSPLTVPILPYDEDPKAAQKRRSQELLEIQKIEEQPSSATSGGRELDPNPPDDSQRFEPTA